MISAGDLKKGVTLKLDNNLFRVTGTEYNKPGRGTASMKTTLMNLKSGQTVTKIFGIEEKLDNLFVENEDVQYLYRDGDFLHFMNKETYEQYEASVTLFGNDA
ncbi:MAG: elongation factor P, partial [Anaerolineae bacterium]|nr:elongation factor P [Anaerolineae bacterium]